MFILSSFYFLFTILFILILLYNQHTKVLSKNINTVQYFLHRGVYSISFLIIWLLLIQENPFLDTISISLILFSFLISFGILISVEALKHVKYTIVILLLCIGYIIFQIIIVKPVHISSALLLGTCIILAVLSVLSFLKNKKNRIGVMCVLIAVVCFSISFYSFPTNVYANSIPKTTLYLEVAFLFLSILFSLFTKSKFREVVTNSEFNFFYLGLLSISIYVCIAFIDIQLTPINNQKTILYILPIFTLITYFSAKDKLDRNENFGMLFYIISLSLIIINDAKFIVF